MKFILIAISALIMSCAAKPAKVSPADASKPATAPATKEVKASAKAVATVGDVNCSYGDVKRELKVVQSPERCTVEYTKDGATQEIGSGAAGSTFCAEIVERVKNNLVAAGYKCEI